ncbi:MAG UNVERIFIED_CONTAM: hypothetical protein LOD86_10210 [Thermobifida fusca]
MWGELVAIIVPVSFMVTTAAVILLWPITRRLGEYLEALAQEKRMAMRSDDSGRIQQALEEVSQRLALLEERVEFAEKLQIAKASGTEEG